MHRHGGTEPALILVRTSADQEGRELWRHDFSLWFSVLVLHLRKVARILAFTLPLLVPNLLFPALFYTFKCYFNDAALVRSQIRKKKPGSFDSNSGAGIKARESVFPLEYIFAIYF
jgi:hypothetical protein